MMDANLLLGFCGRRVDLRHRPAFARCGKLTPAHMVTVLVVAGAILSGLELYQPLIDFAGAGASVPITSFGNALVQGALSEAKRSGLVGIVTGIFEVTSAGISSAIIFAFLASLVFRPKG